MSCEFSLTNKSLIKSYANVYQLSTQQAPSSMVISQFGTIPFNKHDNLTNISVIAKDKLLITRPGNYNIRFSINYLYGNLPIQVGVMVNGTLLTGNFAENLPFSGGVGKLDGELNTPLKQNDVVQLVNLSTPFTMRYTNNTFNERIARLTIEQV